MEWVFFLANPVTELWNVGFPGTLDDPIIVKSFGDEQYAGCTGYPADSHSTAWLVVCFPSPLFLPLLNGEFLQLTSLPRRLRCLVIVPFPVVQNVVMC